MLPTTRIAAMALTITLLFGACSDSGGGEASTTVAESTTTAEPTTTVAETTTTVSTVEDEIEAAYRAHWDAYVEIFAAPDPNNPLIDQHFTGDAKQAVLDAIARHLIDGTAVRAPDDPADFAQDVLSVDVDGGEAQVISCVVDGLVVVDSATGTAINDNLVTLRRATTMLLSDGRWKVSAGTSERLGEGRLTCDA